MKLEKIEISYYRSIFGTASGGKQSLEMDLGGGINALVGPNNTGKSNVVRALRLALDPSVPFDRRRDFPGPTANQAVPRITLTFRRTQSRGTESTLFKYIQEYEESVPGVTSTYAADGLARFYVSFPGSTAEGGARREQFLTRKGATLGSEELLQKAIRQMRERVLRFVFIESGADLSALLRGNFREILHTVLTEHLRDEYDAAQARHEDYVAGLESDLLRPLGRKVEQEVASLFPEMQSVSLTPNVRLIGDTLEDVRIDLTDSVTGELRDKGTGVRGGVLVAMLQYLADNSRRSLIIGLEEPEAFLHPSAQEGLRDDLEALAHRDDVTALVTTHSPFIISQDQAARIFQINKSAEGCTSIFGVTSGDEPRTDTLATLFRTRALAQTVDAATRVPPGTLGILVTEGTTDIDYFRSAARAADREDLIEGIHLVAGGGAIGAAVQAIVLMLSQGLPVVALFDSDQMGAQGRKLLEKFSTKLGEAPSALYITETIGRKANPPLETEDLMPTELLERFIADVGKHVVDKPAKKIKGFPNKHFDINGAGKERLPGWFDANVKQEHTALLIQSLAYARSALVLDQPD